MLTPTAVFDRLFRFAPASFGRHREEVERIFRFIFIGGVSFVFNAGLYLCISRVLWTGGNRTLQNFFSVLVTSVLNYLAHRAWTFRARGSHVRQVARYGLVALSAIALQSVLFWIGYHVLHIHDLIVIFIVAILIPFYTYLAHKLFTFRAAHVL